jgi:HEAT repeat protein
VLKLEPPEEYLEGMGLEAISSSETLENSAQPVFQTYLEQLFREMLVQLQELATNPLTRFGVSLKLDDISERGLPQLKAEPKCNSDFPTRLIQALAEGDKITSLTHQQFFDRVFRKNFYAFFHSTFLEYFAAGAIADDWRFFLNPVPGNPAAGSYRLFDESKWLDAYLFWLGQPAVPSEAKVSLLRALVAFEDECTDYNFYRLRGYFIAAKGLPEFKDCPPSLADEIVGTIVQLSLGIFEAEHQPLIRTHRSIAASARRALLRSDANRAVDLIVHNLSLIVEKEDLQEDIAKILEKIAIGNLKVIQALSQLLLRNPDNKTKEIWVNCLGKIGIGDANAIYTLTQLFHQSSDEDTRLKFAKILIELDPNNNCAIAFFIERVLADPYELFFYKNILKQAGVDNQISTTLIQRLHNTNNHLTGLRIANFLSLINPKEALSYIQNLLDNPEDEIRFKAAWTWQRISPNNPQIIQTLNKVLTSQNNWLVLKATGMLGYINSGSTEVQNALTKLLNSKDDKIVLIAARQSHRIKVHHSQIIDRLLEIVGGSKDEAVREESARLLLRMAANNHNVTKAIIELFYKRQDWGTHQIVVWYLGEIIPASSEAIKVLIECLSSPINQSIQSEAVYSLGKVGEKNDDAVSALISLLQSSTDVCLQRRIVSSLMKIGLDNLNVIGALEKIIDETKDEDTYFLAAYALSQTTTGKSRGVEALKNLISFSGSLFFLFPALEVLWQQLPGDINLLKTLIELLLDNGGNTNTLDLDITSTYGSFRRRIADFLKSQVFTEQLPVIINTIKSYKSSQDEANVILYENFGSYIIWHYTQKLPYDKFYQACRGE